MQEFLWLSDYGIRLFYPGGRVGSLSPYCGLCLVLMHHVSFQLWSERHHIYFADSGSSVSARFTFRSSCSECGRVGVVVGILAYPMMRGGCWMANCICVFVIVDFASHGSYLTD